MEPLINITISTFNRSDKVRKAIDSALSQDYENFTVTVIDDCSTDDTRDNLAQYFDNPNFCYIQLAKNIGTYQIRNLSLLINKFEAITFHDSDDIAYPQKLRVQSRAMFQSHIGESRFRVLNYQEKRSVIDFVVNKVKYEGVDGNSYESGSLFSLISYICPNVYLPNENYESFTHVTNGLIHKRVFEKVGGYYPSRVGADLEFRDRTLLFGFNYKFVDEPLMSMFANDSSLTIARKTSLDSDYRKQVEKDMYSRLESLRYIEDKESELDKFKEIIKIDDLEVAFVSNPKMLSINELIPAHSGTLSKVRGMLEEFSS